MKTLVLITNKFPFHDAIEESFVLPEIEAFLLTFDRVIVSPCGGSGKISSKLPNGIEVYTGLASPVSTIDKIKALFSRTMWQHLHADTSQIKNIGDLSQEAAFDAYVMTYRHRIEEMINTLNIDIQNSLFYTFWFDYATTALSLSGRAKIVTRCHGYDIYGDRHFISDSWRADTLERLLKCFPASAHGADFLKSKFPRFTDKITYRLLGSKSPVGPNPTHSDNTINLLGCARLSEEKGIVSQLSSIIDVAAAHPDCNFHYTHIGDGPLMSKIRLIVKKSTDNLKITLLGEISNEEVHRILETTPFDIFLLLSRSEGGMPIALAEALSYGIPAIVTKVGGISTHFSDGGILLSPDSSSQELGQAIFRILENHEYYTSAARNFWESQLSAHNLRREFSKELSDIFRVSQL